MCIRKHIPNTITSMNLLCGILGVIFTLEGRPDTAFLLMLAAAAADFCDGLAARLLEAYSEIGKELDSLADAVSFGVLPSLMLYKVSGPTALRFAPLLLAAFSALRLAKFNLDERQHDSFIGLPTPASAMLCGSLAFLATVAPDGLAARWCAGPVLVPALTLVLSCLLVCEVPMFAMKFGGGKKSSRLDWTLRALFLAVVLAAAVFALVAGMSWPFVVLAAFAGYIIINLLASFHRPGGSSLVSGSSKSGGSTRIGESTQGDV